MKQEKPHLKKSTGITPREYSIIFLCLGIVFFFIGLYFLQKVIHLHNNGIVITGTVVDYKLEIKGYKVRDFADYFKVDTTEGVFRVIINDWTDVGSEVTFIYDPEDRDTTVLLSNDYGANDAGIYELIGASNTDFILIFLWGLSLVFFMISGWCYMKNFY